ncbi:hypothetical protein ES703_106247 [subsurface metagenome]
MRKYLPYILGAVIFLAERGMDVSGVENLTLAIILWSICGALLLLGVCIQFLPKLKRARGKSIKARLDEPEISIEIDKCSRGNSVIRYGRPIQTIEVALTLNVKSPPINVADLQLYMGDEILQLVSPTVPITQENNKGCYIAKYQLSLATIYNVPIDRRNKYHLCVVAMGQKWYSEEFSIHNP